MPNQHRYRLMRPHSALVEQLPGEYPESVNTALADYLQLLRPEMIRLLDAIATSRGIAKAEVMQMALIRFATIEEAETAGLVE